MQDFTWENWCKAAFGLCSGEGVDVEGEVDRLASEVRYWGDERLDGTVKSDCGMKTLVYSKLHTPMEITYIFADDLLYRRN